MKLAKRIDVETVATYYRTRRGPVDIFTRDMKHHLGTVIFDRDAIPLAQPPVVKAYPHGVVTQRELALHQEGYYD